MRAGLLLSLALAAGCIGSPDASPSPPTATPSAPAAGADGPANESAPIEPIGERQPTSNERFAFLENRTLGVIVPGSPELPLLQVPETLSPTAFFESFASGITLPVWPSPPFASAWETTGDVEITIHYATASPATSMSPSAAGFPAVGGWFGTAERYAYFLQASDAPDTIEPGRVYTSKLRVTPPQGGFFVHDGEQLALHTFLAYKTADGSPVSYVIGGPDPAGLVLPHQHFNLSALQPVVILDESGDLEPNPGVTGDMQQHPVDLPFQVPPEAVYVRMEVTGSPKAGSRVDIDLSAQTPGGETIAAGTSPHSSEVVVLGPGNLKAHGRDLVAHLTNSASVAGSMYRVTITAFVP